MAYGECLYPERRPCLMSYQGKQRRSNNHHLYWPANEYKTELEQAFRQLTQNQIQLCLCEHYLIHEAYDPPKKPTVTEMIMALTVKFEDES